MSTGDLLNIQPAELKFPFELKKQSSCSTALVNKTDKHVAFKVKTTNPKKYCVRPNNGVVLPGSSCNITVTMQAQKEAPPDLQCKDKFLIQCVVVPYGSGIKDITPEMFNKEDGNVVEEFKLRVVYIPANPPSPVHEGSEEGSPRASVVEDGKQITSLPPDHVKRSLVEPAAPKPSSADGWSLMSRLTDEKASVLRQNEELRQELDMLRRVINKTHGGFSMSFVVLVGLLGLLVGYLMKKTA